DVCSSDLSLPEPVTDNRHRSTGLELFRQEPTPDDRRNAKDAEELAGDRIHGYALWLTDTNDRNRLQHRRCICSVVLSNRFETMIASAQVDKVRLSKIHSRDFCTNLL